MDRRIQIIASVIDNEFCRGLNTKKAALLVNLSPSRLRHLFKLETGKTFAQYLAQKRMQEATALLKDTCLTVKEIKNHLGVTDDSHFTHQFKRAHGLAPAKYRLTGK
jgi:two-component system response regulator YesN